MRTLAKTKDEAECLRITDFFCEGTLAKTKLTGLLPFPRKAVTATSSRCSQSRGPRASSGIVVSQGFDAIGITRENYNSRATTATKAVGRSA
jgi:hypothetical protein